MKKFVDEIEVCDQDLMYDIIAALENKATPSEKPYEVELYDCTGLTDPLTNKRINGRFRLKIFVKE